MTLNQIIESKLHLLCFAQNKRKSLACFPRARVVSNTVVFTYVVISNVSNVRGT